MHKEEESISLNKFISGTGMCSRREADKWIDQGRVKINGKKAIKGNRVFKKDKVTVNDRLIRPVQKRIYILLNKPAGVTCTTDRRDRSNIVDFLNRKQRIFPVGRLDKNSTGAIILTNDGDIVNQILRKENHHEKEYLVTVDKEITDRFLSRMAKPIPMLGTSTLPCKVRRVNQKVFRITLTQGLNRQIRRMCEYCGYKAIALKRIRIKHLKLAQLKAGEWRYLTEEEINPFLQSQ